MPTEVKPLPIGFHVVPPSSVRNAPEMPDTGELPRMRRAVEPRPPPSERRYHQLVRKNVAIGVLDVEDNAHGASGSSPASRRGQVCHGDAVAVDDECLAVSHSRYALSAPRADGAFRRTRASHGSDCKKVATKARSCRSFMLD
jgi:hypothetical protein